MSREDYIPEQHGFTYQNAQQGRQPIPKRRSLAPGQGNSYQQPPANPHRAGHSSGLHGEDQPFMTGDPRYPQAQKQRYTQRRTSAPQDEDEYEDDVDPPRLPTSTRRYQPGIYGQPTQAYKQGNRTFVRHTGAPPQQSYPPPQPYPVYTDSIDVEETERPASTPKRGHTRKMRFHPLVYLGAGMIVMFFLWVVLSLVSSWGRIQLDDWHYGRPRTYQFDALVGHQDSPSHPTHFIAVNLNRHVILVEIPGGDTSKSRIYNVTTLFGDGQDLTPVTLSFTDTNGNGKPDLIIHIQDQRIVFHNDGTQFRPQQ